MAWVCILKTESGKYYIGSTQNIAIRLKQHKSGQTFTTKRLGVHSLVLSQQYKTMADARLVEKKLKKLKRRDYIEKMINDGYIRVVP